MNKTVVGLSLVVVFYSIHSTSADINKIKKQFAELVATPYLFAIALFADDILKPLADIPVPESFGKREYDNLKSIVNDFYYLLKMVETGLNKLVDETNLEIESLVVKQSGIETNLSALRTEWMKIDAEKSHVVTNYAETYKKIVNVTNTLRDISTTWEKDKKKLDKAINCIIHRRKRVVIPLFYINGAVGSDPEAPNIVKDFACRLINKGKIDRSSSRIARAENEYIEYTKQRKTLEADEKRLSSAIEELNQKIKTTDDNLRSIKDTLDALREILKKVVDASECLKQMLTHVSALQAQSKILRNEVEWLIDMNNLIVPLQSVADQITAFVGQKLSGFKSNANIHASITSSIEKIKVNLPKYPWIEN